MESNLRYTFDEVFAHVKFDYKLQKAIHSLQVGFVNKNEEHMHFFGGCLLGVQVVRFTAKNNDDIFDTLGVDEESLTAKVRMITTINHDFVVSSDILNLTLMYCVYRFKASLALNRDARELGARDCLLLFLYRCMTSLLSNYFKYPADPKIAQATYNTLSNKYLIKKMGSWQEVFLYRANEALNDEGIHGITFNKFDSDEGIVITINDIRNRIKDMVKNIYAVFKKVHVSGEKVHTTTATGIDSEGIDIIKDRLNGPDIYNAYIMKILADKNSFIKEELLAVIDGIQPNSQLKALRHTLEWLSVHIHHEHTDLVEKFIKLVLTYTIQYLYSNEIVLKQYNDMLSLTVAIKNLYMSSRASDESLLEIRELGKHIVVYSENISNEQNIATIRNGVILYICLRAFSKSYYT